MIPRNALVQIQQRPNPNPDFGHIPPWKQDLLQQADIYNNQVQLLNTGGATVVTDGGVSVGKGYFGVVKAVGNTVIARVQGEEATQEQCVLSAQKLTVFSQAWLFSTKCC